jgi:glycosyltransferase involved in cell wall biosynthesis
LLNEIVIVDGGSKDGTWEVLEGWAQKYLKLRVYQVPGANIGCGRNEAIKRTESEIIVSFDSGTKYPKNWLKLMLKPFWDEGAEVVGGRTIHTGETFFETCAITFKDVRKADIQPSHRGCAFCKKVWQKIGGYPAHVEGGEDTWFNTQWMKFGFKCVYVPEAKQYWMSRKRWVDIFEMRRRNTKGHIALGETSGMITNILVTIVCVLSAIFIVLGFFNPSFWYIAGVLYGANVVKRMLCRGRWKVFINPVKALVGFYILLAFDLGMTLGALEGAVLFLRDKITGRK